MSYEDRLRSCLYIAPSGKTVQLHYDGVEREVGRKASAHEGAAYDGGIIQDLNKALRRYPIVGYVTGPDYDLLADEVAAALDEKTSPGKRGRLQHPRWGAHDVTPIGYSQIENLVEEQWRATFNINFYEAIDTKATTSTSTPAAIKSAASKAYTAAATVKKTASLASDIAKLKKIITKSVDFITGPLRAMTAALDDLNTQITGLAASIERNIDQLIMAPVDLCAELVQLISLPAQIEATAKSKVQTYKTLVDMSLTSLTDALGMTKPDTEAQAAASSSYMIALGIAAHEAAATGTLYSRDDAVMTAEYLAALYAAILALIEGMESDTGYMVDPDLMATLAQIAANTQDYLLSTSYSLKLEKRVILPGDFHTLQFIRKYIGPVDDYDEALDNLIAWNNLGGDLLDILPRGYEVRYFV